MIIIGEVKDMPTKVVKATVAVKAPVKPEVKPNVFLWYSGATDATGKALAEALSISCGLERPATADIIIGWGAKTDKDFDFGKTTMLNSPNQIRRNRNKFESLTTMLLAGVNVAPFTASIEEIGAANKVTLPAVGRTKFHQGGKGFWICPTMTHVKSALNEGAHYFQRLIEIKDEFRLHTFGDKVIYAVKKVKRTTEEMEDAYIKHEMERQKSLASKAGEALDEKTALMMLKRQAKKFAADGANMLIRSNRMGWKFVRVDVDKVLEAQAVKALKALKLDFGAIDACVDATGKPWIIEVNTGPGLEESPFAAYVAALKEKITPAIKAKPVVETVVGVADKKPVSNGSSKAKLLEKAALMQDMVKHVETDAEAAVLDKVFSKMFGG